MATPNQFASSLTNHKMEQGLMVFVLFIYALFWSLFAFVFLYFFWCVWGDEYFSWVGHLGCDVSRRIPYTPFFIEKKIFGYPQSRGLLPPPSPPENPVQSLSLWSMQTQTLNLGTREAKCSLESGLVSNLKFSEGPNTMNAMLGLLNLSLLLNTLSIV